MTIQIAVKLPDELVDRLDELVRAGRVGSRSAGVRRALESLVAAEERHRIDTLFAEGFRRLPHNDAEIAEATRLAADVIAEEPWERWW